MLEHVPTLIPAGPIWAREPAMTDIRMWALAAQVRPECAELGSRAAMSHANNHRVDPPRSQQRPNVVIVAGKNPVLVVHKQRHVSVSKVSCVVRSEELADSPSCGLVERRYVDTR